ncbi:hypothetical protein AB0L40_10950 [Patulibacter sp. NPDC049589]|uniref:hypothetical protein n=1 Tax=Patulibacter sp. NPDC049589 TaxID=3154731 RepID=UPI003448F5B2
MPRRALGHHARVAGVTLTLDDPSPPTATINGPAGGWTTASSAPVTAGGQDPQSGISRLGLVVKTGGSTRRPVVGTWNQDTTGGSLPGWATTRSSPSTIALPRTGTVTVATVARNGAGTESTSTPITIRVDRTAPTITWPKKLQGGQTATIRDTQSGIATLTAKINSKTATTNCTPAAKQCKVKIPTTANGTLRITTTDQAGNDTTGQRTVRPRPKGGGGGPGSGGGSKGGAKKPPARKPGSKKPTASYCKKHPLAKACTGASAGSSPIRRQDRATPRGTKVSKVSKAKKSSVPRGCRQRALALSGAGSFAINNLCSTDDILWRGKPFKGTCQGKHDVKVKGKIKRVPYVGCRYQVQQIRPQGQRSGYYCAIVPLESTNANPGPAGSGIGKSSGKKLKVKVSKGKDPCSKDLRKMCSDGYKDCKKSLVAEYIKRCKSKKPYIPLSAMAAMVNASTSAGTTIDLNLEYLTARKYQLPLCTGVNPMPDKPGTKKPKRGQNASGPVGDSQITFTCADALPIDQPPAAAAGQPPLPPPPTPKASWRWLSKDGKYVMVRFGPEVLGGSHWSFVPVEALLGPAPPAAVSARAKALCRLSEQLTDPTQNPTITIAGQHTKVPQWGNVQVCGVFATR